MTAVLRRLTFENDMTKYPNSECDAHRNVETNAPVCIVCMDIEIARLREALENIASFAPGNGDVCEIIAQRARQALTPNGQGQRGDDGLIVGDSAAP